MRSRAVAPLLALLPLAASLAGCAAVDDAQRFLDRMKGKAEFSEVPKLDETVTFQPGDLPPIPPATVPPPLATTLASFNFTIPPATRSLHVSVAVRFDNPLGLPAGLPLGNVTVSVAPPEGTARTYSFSESGSAALDVEGPAIGGWKVDVQALGSGTVRVLATAIEPANP